MIILFPAWFNLFIYHPNALVAFPDIIDTTEDTFWNSSKKDDEFDIIGTTENTFWNSSKEDDEFDASLLLNEYIARNCVGLDELNIDVPTLACPVENGEHEQGAHQENSSTYARVLTGCVGLDELNIDVPTLAYPVENAEHEQGAHQENSSACARVLTSTQLEPGYTLPYNSSIYPSRSSGCREEDFFRIVFEIGEPSGIQPCAVAPDTPSDPPATLDDYEKPEQAFDPLPRYCQECDAIFGTPYGYQRHVHKNHPGKKAFGCVKGCVKTYYDIHNLYAHQTKFHGRPETYGKRGKKMNRKLQHYASTVPTFCLECKRHFDSISDLTCHNKSEHRGKRMVKCDVGDCGKKYANICNLYKHQRLKHGREKTCFRRWAPSDRTVRDMKLPLPTFCVDCHLECGSVSQYTIHGHSKHPGKALFTCTIEGCTKSYVDLSGMYKHQNSLHGRRSVKRKFREK